MGSNAVAISLGVLIPLVVLLLVLILIYLYRKHSKRQRRKFQEVSFKDNPVMTGKLPETPRNSDIKSMEFVYDNSRYVINGIVEEETETSFSMEVETKNKNEKTEELTAPEVNVTTTDNNLQDVKATNENTNDKNSNEVDSLHKTQPSDGTVANVRNSQDRMVAESSNDKETGDKGGIMEELRSESNKIEVLQGAVSSNGNLDESLTNNDDVVIADKNDDVTIVTNNAVTLDKNDEVTFDKNDDVTIGKNIEKIQEKDASMSEELNLTNKDDLSNNDQNVDDAATFIQPKPSSDNTSENSQNEYLGLKGTDKTEHGSNTNDTSSDDHSESEESSKNFEDVPL